MALSQFFGYAVCYEDDCQVCYEEINDKLEEFHNLHAKQII